MTHVNGALRQAYLPIHGIFSRSSERLRAGNWARWRWLLYPFAAFAVTRIVVMCGAYLAEIALPSQTGAEFWHAVPENVMLDVMARWDSGFYLGIARDGYSITPGQMSTVAFFPVYPMLMNLLSPLVGGNLVLAGVLVSNLLFFVALVFLYLLTELVFGDSATAQRTIFYLAAFPTAFFFSAVYTESTFLAFSIGTFYFAASAHVGMGRRHGAGDVCCAHCRRFGVGRGVAEWMGALGGW